MQFADTLDYGNHWKRYDAEAPICARDELGLTARHGLAIKTGTQIGSA